MWNNSTTLLHAQPSILLTLNKNAHSAAVSYSCAFQTSNTGILSSLRCPHSTECKGTGDHLPTSRGFGWSWSVSRSHPLEHRTTTHCTREGDQAHERDKPTSHNEGCGGRDGDHQWICKEAIQGNSAHYSAQCIPATLHRYCPRAAS